MKLPLLLSVPHAGLTIPAEVEQYCILTPEEVAADGDEGAQEIYALADQVDGFVTSDIARAIVDLNRAEDDIRKDGVVKTHTCWDIPIYRKPLSNVTVRQLIDRYHRPYHASLSSWADKGLLLGIDCHTMADQGPPVGPDAGAKRPAICLSNADGTCPQKWLLSLASCLEDALGQQVALNEPFRGGHIIRAHSTEMPWIQLEHSRHAYMSVDEKRRHTLYALQKWCALQKPE